MDLAVRKVWEVEIICFLAEGRSKHQNLGPPTNQAYLGTGPPWRLTRPGKIRGLRFKVVFRIFKLVARYSNYDFWVPGNILGLGKNSRKIYRNIIFRKPKIKIFKILKSRKLSKKLKIRKCWKYRKCKKK